MLRFRSAVQLLLAWLIMSILTSCALDGRLLTPGEGTGGGGGSGGAAGSAGLPDSSVSDAPHVDGNKGGGGSGAIDGRAPDAGINATGGAAGAAGTGGAAGVDASAGAGGSAGIAVDASPDVSLRGDAGDGGDAAPICDCEGGVCYRGACCRGCWDGSTCRSGADPGACGVGGVMCQSCDDGKACTADKCNANGTCGHDPLTGTTCATGVCVGDVCHCGSSGEPCCATGQACEGTQVCQNGHCGTCGAIGQACCATTTPCAVGGTCNAASMCERCGGSGQLCCPGTVPCGSSLNCDTTNHCAACGALSQACCAAGSACGTNLTCAAGTCQCGGIGQACCGGTQCTDDGNRCNGTESCQGTCQHVSPVTCTALDQCHQAGTCTPATGACSNPNQNNGFSCSDNNACTVTDTCQAGVCQSGTPKACASGQRCDTSNGNCICDATSCGAGCCSATMACQAGTADTACGGSGRACTSCSSAQVCLNQACVACGGAGQPCCHPNNTCSTGNRCDTGTSTCQPCGGLGQACCSGAAACNTFGACLSNVQCAAKDVWVGAQFPDDGFGNPFGAALHWNGSTWSESDVFELSGMGRVFGSSAQDVWFTGTQGPDGGGFAHFPSGFTSTPVAGGLTAFAGQVWAASSTDVWVAGSTFINNVGGAAALHWNGAMWTSFAPLNTNSSLQGVWGNGPNDVWEVGTTGLGAGAAVHWTNGFSSTSGFNILTIPSVSGLTGAWGSGPNDVWASGQLVTAGVAAGAVAHFDTGVWSGKAITGTTNLNAVSGTGASDVWLVGNNGIVGVAVHITSFAATPAVMTVVNSSTVRGVWAAAPNDVWAVADVPTGGAVVHWNGTAWTTLQTFAGAILSGIWGVNH